MTVQTSAEFEVERSKNTRRKQYKAVGDTDPDCNQQKPSPKQKHAADGRRRRVVPVNKMNKPNGEKGGLLGSKRKAARRTRKSALTVETSADKIDNDAATPVTTASAGVSSDENVRSSADVRSPGIEKSPGSQRSMPDFIAQTDRHGNATTPRSSKGVTMTRKHPRKNRGGGGGSKNSDTEGEIDPCETVLDSIRLMCCCLLPEENQATKKHSTPTSPNASKSDTGFFSFSKSEDEKHPGLLPEVHPDDQGKKCLVLDLDETLVHSSFRAVPSADFVIPVQIEDVVHFVYVAKRPGVDEFLIEMAKHYEVVIYTASLNKYADPLLDLLDPNKVIRSRLFRESCVYYEGNYVKDLSLLDRDLSQAIIVDNSPNSYLFHPENAIDCSSFIDDPEDRELDQIGSFLAGIKDVTDVRRVCSKWREWPQVDIDEISPGSDQ